MVTSTNITVHLWSPTVSAATNQRNSPFIHSFIQSTQSLSLTNTTNNKRKAIQIFDGDEHVVCDVLQFSTQPTTFRQNHHLRARGHSSHAKYMETFGSSEVLVQYISLTLHSATCQKTALWGCAYSFSFSSYLTENRQSITNTSQLWKSYELHKRTPWKMQRASALKHQVDTATVISRISGCSGANTLPNCRQC